MTANKHRVSLQTGKNGLELRQRQWWDSSVNMSRPLTSVVTFTEFFEFLGLQGDQTCQS